MVYTLDTMTGEELKHARLRLEMTQKELGDENNQQAALSASNFFLLKDGNYRFTAGVESNGSTTLQMFGKEKEEMKLTSFGLLFRDKAGKHRLMAGAVGMIVYAIKFGLVTHLWEHQYTPKFLHVNGLQWWFVSWTLLILAAVLQLLLYLEWLPPEWFPSSK